MSYRCGTTGDKIKYLRCLRAIIVVEAIMEMATEKLVRTMSARNLKEWCQTYTAAAASPPTAPTSISRPLS